MKARTETGKDYQLSMVVLDRVTSRMCLVKWRRFHRQAVGELTMRRWPVPWLRMNRSQVAPQELLG